MWGYLEGKLHDRLLCTRITDKLQGGIADVNYLDKLTHREGWFEMKYLEKWPAKGTDVLRVADLRADQALFLNRRVRWANTARAGVLLRVGSLEWVYWRAQPELEWLTWIRGPNVMERWDGYWPNGLDVLEFIQALVA